MGTKSQPFRVFVAGQTISDGREITPEMIDQCVETFDPATYTPRINIEHISGYSPQPPFNGYGDVVALEARNDQFTIAGATETRRALYATVDANDQLVQLGQADQKPFPSVELTGSYAGTGKVGMVGLAFTDTPASIGTERMKFSSRAPGTVFAFGTEAADMKFATSPAAPAGVVAAIEAGFAKVAAMFKPQTSEPKPAPQAPANDNDRFAAAITALGTSIAEVLKPVTEAQVAFRTDLDKLRGDLSRTEQPGFSRAPATGAQVDAKFATDC